MYQKSVEQWRRCQGRVLAANVSGSCLKLKGLEPESQSTASLHATSFGKGPSAPGNLELAPKKTLFDFIPHLEYKRPISVFHFTAKRASMIVIYRSLIRPFH